ncbi:hypothetical protein BDV19DRAFT_383097 [Aspergillus venezuelensis]
MAFHHVSTTSKHHAGLLSECWAIFPDYYSSESDSDGTIEWQPGEGICPPTSHFGVKAASTSAFDGRDLTYLLDAFLGLLSDLPPFYYNPPESLKAPKNRDYLLILDHSLEIGSTTHPDCPQRQTALNLPRLLGDTEPRFHLIQTEPPGHCINPIVSKPFQSEYFTNIVLAWSYDIVTNSRWVAAVNVGDRAHYSPWMLKQDGNAQLRGEVPASSNSLFAFNTLLSFCISKDLEYEFLVGFATVLMLTRRNASLPKLPLLKTIVSDDATSSIGLEQAPLHKLYDSLDKCMFLSSTVEGLDSLLCVRKALSVDDEISNHLPLNAESAICIGHENMVFQEAFTNLESLHLPTAICTNISQTFLQVPYTSKPYDDSMTSRVQEFQTSYYCRPDSYYSVSPAPPFGETPIANIALDVRKHILHAHRPILWRLYWVLRSGKKKSAQRQSHYATSLLSNWHRIHEDGLWLDDGRGDVEYIRKLHSHPWIPQPPVTSAQDILRWRDGVEERCQDLDWKLEDE